MSNRGYHRAYYKKNKLKIKARAAEYRKNNSEKLYQASLSYREQNAKAIKIALRTPRRRWFRARQQARRRGIGWGLSLKRYTDIISLPCFYCEGKLGKVVMGIGLDRIISSRGYHKNNVVSCCRTCNVAKNSLFSSEETKRMISVVLTMRGL